MSYIDSGYSPFLTRAENLEVNKLNPFEFENFVDELPGEKIVGLLESLNKRFKIDLNEQIIRYSDGNVLRVEVGETSRGPGIIIYDKNGEIIFESTEVNGIGGSAINRATIRSEQIDFANFIRISPTSSINSFSLGANTAVTVTMTLESEVKEILMAIPRWSFYDGTVSDANELTGITTEYDELTSNFSWQKTAGANNNYIAVLKASIRNITGAPRNISFRGDWIYIGNRGSQV